MDRLVNAYLDYRSRSSSESIPTFNDVPDERPLGGTECLALNNIDRLVNAYLDNRSRSSESIPTFNDVPDERPLGGTECLALNNIELIDIFSE
jgi:hypothetical protein